MALEYLLKVQYNSRDISTSINQYLISFSYKDKVEGEADEVEIVLENKDKKWSGAWYPDKGATLNVQIGYSGKMMDCGEFEIDEVELSGSAGGGDTVTIKALSAAFTKSVRTKKGKRHEKKTLREIANTVAATHGMTVQGITTNVVIENVTQNRKTDLGFLAGLAAQYGYYFSVKGKILVFTRIYDLEKVPSVLSLDRTDLSDYKFKDKSYQTYKAARVKYNDPVSGDTIEGEFNSEQDVNSDDTFEIREKVENRQQAEEQARAALHRANTRQREGSISFIGEPLAVAGVNISLTGLGVMCGKYFITSSSHKIDRGSGYRTDVDIKGVEIAPPSAKRVTKQVAPPSVNEPPIKYTWVNIGSPLDNTMNNLLK